jgi:hypothetical protein
MIGRKRPLAAGLGDGLGDDDAGDLLAAPKQSGDLRGE